MTSRTNRTWRSCESEKVGLKLVIVIGLLVALAFVLGSIANGQEPVYQYEQTYAVPVQVYQPYTQVVTLTPGQPYYVPMQGYGPRPSPFYRPKPRQRGVLFFGPFPIGNYYY